MNSSHVCHALSFIPFHLMRTWINQSIRVLINLNISISHPIYKFLWVISQFRYIWVLTKLNLCVPTHFYFFLFSMLVLVNLIPPLLGGPSLSGCMFGPEWLMYIYYISISIGQSTPLAIRFINRKVDIFDA